MAEQTQRGTGAAREVAIIAVTPLELSLLWHSLLTAYEDVTMIQRMSPAGRYPLGARVVSDVQTLLHRLALVAEQAGVSLDGDSDVVL